MIRLQRFLAHLSILALSTASGFQAAWAAPGDKALDWKSPADWKRPVEPTLSKRATGPSTGNGFRPLSASRPCPVPESLFATSSLPAAASFSALSTLGGATEGIGAVKVGVVPHDKRAFFAQISQAIQSRKDRIREILSQFDNVDGTNLEFDLVDRLLKGAPETELYNLEHMRELENVAVYAATNVPLYTLIGHGVIPASVSKNVWFRTPEMTREVYSKLYAELVSALPPGVLDGLHLLTENADVQYDNFAKIYVMGMNRRGTRSERAPSELVLFTGNPETAKTILSRFQDKVRKSPEKFPDFKQVFLGYGAGINPIVVTQSAGGNMAQVVHWALEPVRINGGQDCMAADFYAVNTRVIDQFKTQLVSRIRALKPGATSDPEAGYSPLTMSKNFDSLISYRDRYKDYLVNPEATIDPEKKLVSPHVFVFPFSMFKEVEMREHFGPFYTIFTYADAKELTVMAKDPRVQRKAMFATVLGGNMATPDITEAKRVFQENRHTVSVNETLFGDLNGNIPFGGKGPDSSIIAQVEYSKDGGFKFTSGHYPTLFSNEANLAFGDPKIYPAPALKDREYYQRLLGDFIAESRKSLSEMQGIAPVWRTLLEPQTVERPRGLKAIREVIAKEGYAWVRPGARPDPATVRSLEEFYGVSFIFESDLSPTGHPVHGKGVILHPSEVGNAPSLLNLYRGTINPHLGLGGLHAIFDSNKLLEYYMAEAIQPGIMARTERFGDLLDHHVIGSRFLDARDNVRHLLNEALAVKGQMNSAIRETLRSALREMVEAIFSDLRARFPEGAFIKNFGDFGTADMGTQITTMTSLPKAVAGEYLRRFEFAKRGAEEKFKSYRGTNPGPLSLGDSVLEALMGRDPWEMSTRFVRALVGDSSDLIAQSRVKLLKTPMGFPLEVRVDFVDGEPVYGKLRFGHEYMPDEVKKAVQLIRDLFSHAPEALKYLSGGADVVFLADGTLAVMEFNIGSSSGTLEAGYFPIDCNEFNAALTGKTTPMLARFEQAFQGGFESQKALLTSMKHVKKLFWKSSIDDMSTVEVAKWMRNRLLIEWEKAPTPESAEHTISELKRLFDGFGPEGEEDLNDLIYGAEHFIQRRLRESRPAQKAKPEKPEFHALYAQGAVVVLAA